MATTLPIHPRTGLRAVYVSPKTGRAFWPIAGASDDPPADPPAPSDPPADPPKSDPPSDDWAKTFEGKTPAEVAAAVAESRKWENRSKENFEKAQKFDALVATLGGTPPADPPKNDPPAPTPSADTKPVLIENAVLKTAAQQNVNAARLTDSRSFMGQFADADPTAADFGTKVTDAIKKAAEADPTLLAIPRGQRRSNPIQGRESNGDEKSLSAGAARYAEKRNKRSTTSTST